MFPGGRRQPRAHAAPADSRLAFLVAALFSPPDAKLDDHPTRRAICDAVEAHPGIPLNKLRSKLPLGWGTLYHHIRVLEKQGRVETIAIGRRRLLYLPGSAEDRLLFAQGLLEGKTARAIAMAIRDHPATSFKDVLAYTGESERSVYYHLKRLMDAGLVESRSSTRHYGLRATPLLQLCLARLRAVEPADPR